ncbi:hypothetical protein UVI_02003800 [Ustilaginoidea virens]|uniref:Uncharacterized protein n=1 Tax=Ustilaginoidea virens TaxID=1159556 RepID=A0A1B5KV90_USTVR|nr:hypothetical protein UVI_02003800 [Ustilaginoidea virens]
MWNEVLCVREYSVRKCASVIRGCELGELGEFGAPHTNKSTPVADQSSVWSVAPPPEPPM